MVVSCAFCNGTGRSPNSTVMDPSPCEACRGRGKIEITQYKKTEPYRDAYCNGTGVDPSSGGFDKRPCKVCRGAGKLAEA
jgi:DnaJ-class molecular chaperone